MHDCMKMHDIDEEMKSERGYGGLDFGERVKRAKRKLQEKVRLQKELVKEETTEMLNKEETKA